MMFRCDWHLIFELLFAKVYIVCDLVKCCLGCREELGPPHLHKDPQVAFHKLTTSVLELLHR